MNIDPQLVSKAKIWLGEDGIKFFQSVEQQYGTIATAVWMEGGIPHAVHFREGMQVRNWLRENSDWDFDRIENHWDEIVKSVLKAENQ